MGMSIPENNFTPTPKYNDTVVCDNCHAEYKTCQWVHGYSDQGTAGNFTGILVTGCYTCPVCKRKAK